MQMLVLLILPPHHVGAPYEGGPNSSELRRRRYEHYCGICARRYRDVAFYIMQYTLKLSQFIVELMVKQDREFRIFEK